MNQSIRPTDSHYDTLIIGAGMSGLAAGIRLAYYENKVCILEKHSMPGGLNSFYRLGRRNFDVGLHAMTNFVPRHIRHAPLNKLLRQLRLHYDDFKLCQQRTSEVKFPGVALRFSNDFELFRSEVRDKFPKQAPGFDRLVTHIQSYDELNLLARAIPARAVVGEYITDPLLTDMLFCPLMFYGSASEGDMEFGQFVIMFKSIFCEGFARPKVGVRQIVSTLLKKYKACHGELRMQTGVKSIELSNARAISVLLENGERLSADTIISSAGYVETMRMCSDVNPQEIDLLNKCTGKMTFMESISILDRQPSEIGCDQTIVFFNNSGRFKYRPPAEPVDTGSAVVCCPNNFQYDAPLEEGIIRITNIANYDQWVGLDEERYVASKQAWYERSVAEAVQFIPDFRKHVKFVDIFTPRTIHKFTGHLNGAVYGAPEKFKDGRTRISNLFLCGTDQGFLGIIGAMLSGISMANLHVLQRSGTDTRS